MIDSYWVQKKPKESWDKLSSCKISMKGDRQCIKKLVPYTGSSPSRPTYLIGEKDLCSQVVNPSIIESSYCRFS
jgi:hypothetical protein